MKKPISIHATRKFNTDEHDRAMWIGSLVLVVLGALLTFVVIRTSRSGDVRVFGVLMMLGGGSYLLVSMFRGDSPKPRLELSPRGLIYRVIPGKDLVIGWSDISAVETIYRGRRRDRTPSYVTAVIVPRRVYDEQVKGAATGLRSMIWSGHFKQRGNDIQITIEHDPLSVTFDDLRDEIEARWRALSEHPTAREPARPRLEGVGPVEIPRKIRTALSVASAVVLLPAVYYFHWISTWSNGDYSSDAVRDHYLNDLLKRGSLSARKVGGGMIQVGHLQVEQVGHSQCETEIFRDGRILGIFPRYTTTTYCNTDLKLRSGGGAIAVWKMHTEVGEQQAYDDKVLPYRYRAASSLDPLEGEARLCKMGRC